MPLTYVFNMLKISSLNNVLGREASYATKFSLFEFRQAQKIL